jgi:hypothetical protein
MCDEMQILSTAMRREEHGESTRQPTTAALTTEEGVALHMR